MWTKQQEEALQTKLREQAEEGYRRFITPLIPALPPERILGVRIPLLRRLAREMEAEGSAEAFFSALPHTYLEENHLHSFLIASLPMEKALGALEEFLPYVDNWSVCDSLRPRCFARQKEALYPAAKKWATSPHSYTCRFGIEMLMLHFLTPPLSSADADFVASLVRGTVEVDAMIAWYFATALPLEEETIFPYFSGRILTPSCRRLAIRKALESRRVAEATKARLREI